MRTYQLEVPGICDFADECQGAEGCKWLRDGQYLQCTKWYGFVMAELDETERREIKREKAKL